MKIKDKNDIKTLLVLYLGSAAVGVALELKLFEFLKKSPKSLQDVSDKYNIPLQRCEKWLAVLISLNLIEMKNDEFQPTQLSYDVIINSMSPTSWSVLAEESRIRYPVANNLLNTMSHPRSVWEAQNLVKPDYFDRLHEDPTYARNFTMMLYEIHAPLAKILAQTLNLVGVKRMMDLGGGSGIISSELLKMYSDLNSVVVDIPNVCAEGRRIAEEHNLAERLSFKELDFLKEDLPENFDLIIECDVGVYSRDLFQKLHKSLKQGGRFIIVDWWEKDQLSSQDGQKNSLYFLLNKFRDTLHTPEISGKSTNEVIELLDQSGFEKISKKIIDNNTTIIEAYA